MHFALLRRARLAAAESVLVHGAAGGVGTAAGQLAAAFGAHVLAVVSTPDKGEVARAPGAHEVLPVDGFLDEARRLTEGRAWTSSSTRRWRPIHRLPALSWPRRAGWSSSASPVGRSPRSRQIGSC